MSSNGLSTKPYLLRAIYEWCADSGLTPYLSVRVDELTRVPVEYVKNGEIVLNLSMAATRNLTIGNDLIQFSARFNGVSREVSVPMQAVLGIFARENGQGMFFQPEQVPTGMEPRASSPELSGGTEPAIQSAGQSALVPEQEKQSTKAVSDRSRLKLVK